MAAAELGQFDRARSALSQVEANPKANASERSSANRAKDLIREREARSPDSEASRGASSVALQSASRALAAGKSGEAKKSALEAWAALHPNPFALVVAARAAQASGATAEANTLRDRALADAERAASAPPVADLQGPFSGKPALAWSPNGDLIAVGHGPLISLLDPATLLDRAPPLSGHAQPVQYVAFSRDGAKLASVSSDGSAKVWDVASGKLLRTLRNDAGFARVAAFSADGKTLACDSNHTVILWDLLSGKRLKVLKGHLSGIMSLAFSPDGKTLAAGGFDNHVILWAYPEGAQIASLYREGLAGRAVAFSPDGRLIASRSSRSLLLWNVGSHALESELKGDWSDFVTFLPDGQSLLAATVGSAPEKKLVRWKVPSGGVAGEIKGLAGEPMSLALNPGANAVAVSTENYSVSVRDLESGGILASAERMPEKLGAIALSPDGKILAAASPPDAVLVWGLDPGKLLHRIKAQAQVLAFDSSGRLLVAGADDRTVRSFDMGSGAQTKEWKRTGAGSKSAAFDPGRASLAESLPDASVMLWDVGAGTSSAKLSDTEPGAPLAFHPKKPILAAGAGFSDRAVRLISLQGKVLRKLNGHAERSTCMAFSQGGEWLASGSEDTNALLWDATTWAQPRILHHPGVVNAVAFSPDASLLATGCADKTIRIWSTSTGALMRELAGHGDAVRSIVFAADGSFLASSGDDGSVRVWRVGDGTQASMLRAWKDGWVGIGLEAGGQVSHVTAFPSAPAAEPYVLCRFGKVTLPFEVCRERVTQ